MYKYITNIYIHIISESNLFPGVGIMDSYYFLDGIVFCIFVFTAYRTYNFFLKSTQKSLKGFMLKS